MKQGSLAAALLRGLFFAPRFRNLDPARHPMPVAEDPRDAAAVRGNLAMAVRTADAGHRIPSVVPDRNADRRDCPVRIPDADRLAADADPSDPCREMDRAQDRRDQTASLPVDAASARAFRFRHHENPADHCGAARIRSCPSSGADAGASHRDAGPSGNRRDRRSPGHPALPSEADACPFPVPRPAAQTAALVRRHDGRLAGRRHVREDPPAEADPAALRDENHRRAFPTEAAGRPRDRDVEIDFHHYRDGAFLRRLCQSAVPVDPPRALADARRDRAAARACPHRDGADRLRAEARLADLREYCLERRADSRKARARLR